MLEARERRSRFGRLVKWAFWLFQAAMVGGSLATCAAVTPFVTGDDPEVAMGAGLFGLTVLGSLWLLWPAGTLLLGVLLLLTRGRRRVIAWPAESPAAAPQPAPPRPGGSVPRTGQPPSG